jgi:deazaflavin-dependent oxidoreductase (nitroreductase family)
VILTYTGRKTHKKRSLVFHITQYKDEFIVVPGCFGELPNWWRNFRKESKVEMFYKGKKMECLARTIEHDETDAVPRLAEYVRHSHADKIGITAETTEEKFNKLVKAAAKTYPIVTIIPRSKVSSS